MSDGAVKIDTKIDQKGIDTGISGINNKLNGLKGTAGGITSSIGTMAAGALAAVGIAGATAFMKMGVESAATAAAVEAQWGQVFGGIEGPASDMLNSLSAQFGAVPERLKPAMTAFQSYFKGSGMSAEEALGSTEKAMNLAGDAAAMYNSDIESTSASLKSFLMGNLEAGDALGVNTNATKIAKSYNEAYGGSFDDLNDAQKQNYLLEYAEGIFAANGAMGQGAREAESYENVLGNFKKTWEKLMAIVGKPMMDIAIKGMQVLTGWMNIAGTAVEAAYGKFSAFFTGLKNGEGFFGGIGTMIKTFVDLIKGAFSEGNFAGVGAFAGKIIPLIINSLLGGIPRLLQMGAQLLTNLADGMGMSIPELVAMVLVIVTNFITSFVAALPMIIDTGMQLLQGLLQGVITALPEIITAVQSIMQSFLTVIVENLPLIIEMGMQMLTQLITGIIAMLPVLIPMAISIITMLVDGIISNIQTIIDAGIQLLNAVVQGITDNLPTLINAALTLVMALFEGLIDNLPTILDAGVQLLLALVKGVMDMLPELETAAGTLIDTIWDTLKEVDWLELGGNIIAGIAKGIGDAGDALWEAAKGILGSFEDKVKGFFGIASPSKLMRDEVGRFLPLGMAVGMEMEAGSVEKAAKMLSEVAMPDMKRLSFPKSLINRASTSIPTPQELQITPQQSKEKESKLIQQYFYMTEPLSERELQRKARIEYQKLGYGLA